MDVQYWLTVNAIVLVCIFFLAFFFNPDEEFRGFGAIAVTLWAVGISFWVWVGAVAIHFIGKYW